MPPCTGSLVVLLASASVASGFHCIVPPGAKLSSTRSNAVSMNLKDDSEKLELPDLSSFPLQSALLGLITVQSAFSLIEYVPSLFGPSPNYFGAIVNTGFFFWGGEKILKMTGVGKEDYYSTLEGKAVSSFAREAGEYALRGEVPTMSADGYEVATFAGGCFWGTELHFQRLPGVIETCVGYTQGSVERPSYEQVCSGLTGHTEGIQLTFDPSVVSYEQLCDKLLAILGTDVTEKNRVGRDLGTQCSTPTSVERLAARCLLLPLPATLTSFASTLVRLADRHGIYPNSDAQMEAATRAIARCQAKFTTPGKTFKIVTELKPQKVFWPAEGYHQRYLQKGGQNAEKNAPEKVRCYG